MMKKVFALLVCIVLVLTLALSAGAAEQQSFLYSLMQVDDTVLTLVGAPVGEGTITVTVNGESFSNFNVTTALETGLPITYYCMVDQSTSFSEKQKDQQLRGLTTLSSTMRPQDSMILVTMGNQLSFGQPLTDPEERQTAIEQACVYRSPSTALHEYIITTVQTAAQAQNNDSLNCVVLFTDGLDSIRQAGSTELAEQAIRDSGISFNTISVMTPSNDRSVQNNAQQMELFASQSLGGIGITPALDKADSPTNVEDAVADIMRQVLSCSVIQLDIALLPLDGTLDVAVTWELDGTIRADSVTVDTALVTSQTETTPDAIPEPTVPVTTLPETTVPAATLPETTAPATTLPETTIPVTTVPETTAPAAQSTAQTSSGNWLLVLVVACFVLAAVLIAVAVVLWRRRNMEEEAPLPEFTEEDSRFIPDSTPIADIQLDFSGMKDQVSGMKDQVSGMNDPVKQREPAAPAPSSPVRIPSCRVRLIPENHPEGTVELTIEVNNSVTLGRNGKAAVILNETDTSLSGLHFELQWDSRVLYLRDLGSSNGTALNGIPLRPQVWARMENRSIIRAGAVNYMVLVEKK